MESTPTQEKKKKNDRGGKCLHRCFHVSVSFCNPLRVVMRMMAMIRFIMLLTQEQDSVYKAFSNKVSAT